MHNILNKIKTLDDKMEKTENIFLTAILIVMMFCTFTQVILRNVFSTGIIWFDPLSRYLVLWTGFIGASIATKNDKNLCVDALFRILSPLWKKRVRVFTYIISLAVSILLFVSSIAYLETERAGEEIAFLDVPVWIIQIVIPFAFVMISLRFLFKAILTAYYGIQEDECSP